ncbi:alpha/beta hydrolase-fold protein [Cytophagales bacterium LB-30]|uniref:Alpha/beta hydrolase-fold protein n=1 Tax=Shiella aurantiaca TaxID=3058365 RepID=A0ABT8F6C1_9BACT|nr:alpha/beta hydrolase-fold protein [Shiella aurantiaca]MDN4166021.1 alpha/beta hydrolase-fold protein [Shiella aurantiaca]
MGSYTIKSIQQYLLHFAFLGLTFGSGACQGQNPSPASDKDFIIPENASFTQLTTSLDSLSQLLPEPIAQKGFDSLWAYIKREKGVPLTEDDSVAFFYEGSASSVAWNGDFNRWGGQSFRNQGTRLGESSVWMLKQSFPTTARLDYKIVKDGNNWILDPLNPHQQWGGAGPNSELRMPLWVLDSATIINEDVPKGSLSENQILQSSALGYAVQFTVYTPFSYEEMENLPSLYVTDGHEYSDPKMGAMLTVLDNLIADGKVAPLVVVFVDPRNPSNLSQNRRMEELTITPSYLQFFENELIPFIDTQYSTQTAASHRGILGTSLGGLNAAYFGIAGTSFQRIGIHSPAFWYRTQIYSLYQAQEAKNLQIYMSTGVINDTQDGALQMKGIWESKGYSFQYTEVQEGHSWGNWRALIDEVLLHLYPAD